MKIQTNEKGFTLIESLIAILILIVGLFAISQVFVMAMSSNSTANRVTAAAAAGAQQLDRLKAIPYNDPRMQPGGGVVGANGVLSDVAGYFADVDMYGVGRIRVRWQIAMIDNNLRFIRVQAETIGPFRNLSRAQFTTFRACTAQLTGCP